MEADMKRLLCAVLALSLLLVLPGCASDNSRPQTFSTQILSTLANDGDIELTTANAFIITQTPATPLQFVLAGFNATTGSEFRAFLDFNLTGAGGVPGNAIIDDATLDLFIDALTPTSTGSVPIFIDLLNFPP